MNQPIEPLPQYPAGAPAPQPPPAASMPPQVRNAVRAMYAGAAASIVGVIIEILTVSATKTAIERKSRHLTASQLNSTEHVLIIGFVVSGLIAVAAWIILAWACRNGSNWARITGTVLFALSTVDTIVGLTAPIAGPAKIWGGLVWLVALTAIVFLWRPSSTAFFKRTPS